MKSIKIIVLCCSVLFTNVTQLYAQTLDELLQMVVSNNTQLKSIELEYQAVLENKNQVNQLPNPQVGIGVPVLRPETRLGPQLMMVSASQMFPWFGTLKSKEDVVISMSKVKYEQLAIVKLDLFFQLKSAYFQLVFLNQQQSVLLKNIQLFESLESIALAKVESGSATLADVLRVQTKLQGLNQQLLMIDNQKLTFESKINELTKQPLDTKIEVSEDPEIAFEEQDLAKSRTKIESNHPLITQLNYQIEQSNSLMEVNDNMYKPAFGLALDYNLVGKRTDANPVNNGRDILVPKVMVSIPLYRKANLAKNQEEKLIQESLEIKKETVTDNMMALLISYKSELDNAQLELNLLESQIKITQMAYDILIADYSSSGKSFEDLLMVQNQLLEFELGQRQSTLKLNIAASKIERITKF